MEDKNRKELNELLNRKEPMKNGLDLNASTIFFY
jgi:hypothetical protein